MAYIPAKIRKLNPEMTDEQLSGYIDNVWKLCENMRPGEVIVIKSIAKNHPQLFTECVKNYMDEHDWQDGLTFTKGFEAVQKYDISYTKGRKETVKCAS